MARGQPRGGTCELEAFPGRPGMARRAQRRRPGDDGLEPRRLPAFPQRPQARLRRRPRPSVRGIPEVARSPAVTGRRTPLVPAAPDPREAAALDDRLAAEREAARLLRGRRRGLLPLVLATIAV